MTSPKPCFSRVCRIAILMLAFYSPSLSCWAVEVAVPSAESVKSLFEFSGRSRQDSHGFDLPEAYNAPDGFGSLVYEAVELDSDPNPQVGVYEVIVEDFQLNFAGDQLIIPQITAEITVLDNYGCDCFFIDIPYADTFAGQIFDRLFINIQSEFGENALALFEDDSLPTDQLLFPDTDGTSMSLHFYLGMDLTIFQMNPRSVSLSRLPVPEPSTLALLVFATVFALPRRSNRVAKNRC